MKKIVIVTIILLSVFSAKSQVKVISNGFVGIGNLSPSYMLDVQGDSRLNGYVGINGPVPVGYPLGVRSYYGQTISIDPSLSSSIIGASTGSINFYYAATNRFMILYASSYKTSSDSSIKENIESLSPGSLNKVLSLRPVSFNYKNEPSKLNDKKLKNIGLVAQEVELIVPEAVSLSETGKIKMIDYNMLLPVLIKAIQEQQSTIEILQKEISKLKSDKGNLKSTSNSADIEEEIISDISTLEQNAPNPFTQSTEIKYNLPEKSQKANLFIYDMNGLQIKNIPINKKGKGSIIISGSELKAGMYLYTLIVDGEEINTKRMILTE